MTVKVDIPVIIAFKYYTEIEPFYENIKILIPSLKRKELNYLFDGMHYAIFYVGKLPSKKEIDNLTIKSR